MLGQDCRRKYCRPRDQGQSARGQQCFLFAGAFDSYSGQSDRFDVFSSVVADTLMAAVSGFKADISKWSAVIRGEKGSQP